MLSIWFLVGPAMLKRTQASAAPSGKRSRPGRASATFIISWAADADSVKSSGEASTAAALATSLTYDGRTETRVSREGEIDEFPAVTGHLVPSTRATTRFCP